MSFYKKFKLLFILIFVVFSACSGRKSTSPKHDFSKQLFPEDNSYEQALSATLTIKDKIWAVGTDKKKVDSVTLRLSGKRIKKGHTIEDIFSELDPVEGTPSFRLLAANIRNIHVIMQDGIPVMVRVRGRDPFKLKEVLRDTYGLISAYPPKGVKIKKGSRWGNVKENLDTEQDAGKTVYFAKIQREIRAVDGPELIVLSRISSSRKSPVSSKGFNLVGTSKGIGTSLINMQTGKWRAAKAEYTFVVTASKRINGVDTTWVFKEEIVLNLKF